MEIALTEEFKDTLPPAYIGIPSPHIIMVSEDEYWRQQTTMGNKLKPFEKPCSDCAISSGYYLDHAKSLSKQPEEIQEAVLDRWFCHNNCNKACRGVRNFLKINP